MVKYPWHKIYHHNHFQMYSLVTLSTFTLMCNHHRHPFIKLFSSYKTENLLNNNSPIPFSSQTLATTTVAAMNLTTLGTLYKWNCTTICSFVSGVYHLACFLKGRMDQDVLLKLNNVPMYGYTTFFFPIHPIVDTWLAYIPWLLWIMVLWTWVNKYLFETPL